MKGHEVGRHKQGRRRWGTTEELLDRKAILSELGILPGQTVVDAGCGDGYMSREISKLVRDFGRVYALDRDRQAIEKLKAETIGTNVEPVEADITGRTPIEGESVDLIYLSTVFHIFTAEEIGGFRREAKRILKPGGKLAIIEIQKEDTPIGPPLKSRVSPEELRGMIEMKPLSLTRAGQYFYMQVFENV
jgi:ubiquinone/menaquinone biosynthesis C-methylase UbiE